MQHASFVCWCANFWFDYNTLRCEILRMPVMLKPARSHCGCAAVYWLKLLSGWPEVPSVLSQQLAEHSINVQYALRSLSQNDLHCEI